MKPGDKITSYEDYKSLHSGDLIKYTTGQVQIKYDDTTYLYKNSCLNSVWTQAKGNSDWDHVYLGNVLEMCYEICSDEKLLKTLGISK